MATEGKRSATAHRTPAQIRKHGKTYQAKPSQVTKRAKRNAARAKVVKAKGKSAVRGKDVDHKRQLKNGGSNKMSNLRIQSRAKNRGRT